MAAWIVITATDLADYSVGAKVDALRTAALASGQSDPFTAVMPSVVATCRNYIAGRAGTQLSATADSVPPEAKGHTCWLIIESLQARLPGLRLTDEEKRMIDRAWSWYRDVAKGVLPVSTPDDPIEAPVQSPGRITLVSSSPRLATRETLGGL